MSEDRFRKKKTPYSAGENGHAYSCDCAPCANHRALRVARIMAKLPKESLATLTEDRTVYVRAHFRRGHRHLSHYPNTKKAVRDTLRQLIQRLRPQTKP